MVRLLSLLLLGALARTGWAGDWPQFLGPNRDGKSAESGLARSWPEKGPRVVWEHAVGEGYSGPVIAGDRLIVFHRIAGEDVIECLSAATGKPQWKFTYETEYRDRLGKGDGPRSTPVIAGKHVYALAADGRLHCLDLETGKKVWVRALNDDYRVPQSFFGVTTSPLVEGDLVVVNVGGRDAGIVALNRDTGKEVWKATSDPASNASPIAATLNGRRCLVFFTRTGLVVLTPQGEVLHSKRWRARYDASVNAATPLVLGDEIFLSTCYETGALLSRVSKERLDTVWSNDESLSSHFNTAIHHDGHLYGAHGRQEQGAELRCVEWKSGKVKWTKEGTGCTALLLADGLLIGLTESGNLLLIEPTPTAYRELARAKVLGNGARSHPALSAGRLYARDERKLVCFELKK